jgi:hypothetical protein
MTEEIVVDPIVVEQASQEELHGATQGQPGKQVGENKL